MPLDYKIVMSDKKEYMISAKTRRVFMEAAANNAAFVSINAGDINPRYVMRIERFVSEYERQTEATPPVQDDMPKLTNEQREQAKMRLEEIKKAHQIKTGNANKK